MAQRAQKASLAGDKVAGNTNDQTLNNFPEVAMIGKQATSAWQSADRQNTKGDQLAIYALFHASHKVSLMANVYDRKGDIEEVITFDLLDLATVPTNADGNRNNKVMSARTVAIATSIFGMLPEQVDQAFKNRLNRAMQVVFYFHKLGYTLEQVQLTEKNKQQMLKLPFTALNDPPVADDKGAIDEEELDHYNRLKDSSVALDGKTGKTVAELQRRANPPRQRDNNGNNGEQDKAQQLNNAVSFVSAVVKTAVTDDEENDGKSEAERNKFAIAFNKPTRSELWRLHQYLVQYFEADPMDAEEENVSAPKTANARK